MLFLNPGVIDCLLLRLRPPVVTVTITTTIEGSAISISTAHWTYFYITDIRVLMSLSRMNTRLYVHIKFQQFKKKLMCNLSYYIPCHARTFVNDNKFSLTVPFGCGSPWPAISTTRATAISAIRSRRVLFCPTILVE
jgi:hypothetical protein